MVEKYLTYYTQYILPPRDSLFKKEVYNCAKQTNACSMYIRPNYKEDCGRWIKAKRTID